MTDLTALRTRTWLAAGLAPVLAGCVTTGILVGDDTGDTDDTEDTGLERTCDEAPLLTHDTEITGGWGEEELYLVCADPVDLGGSCPPADQANGSLLVTLVKGEHPIPDLCEWGGTVECGPEAARPDACCYLVQVAEWCMGRPYTVDGVARTAALVEVDGWIEPVAVAVDAVPQDLRDALADGWAEAGLAEHASIASLARFGRQLRALGAPASLVDRTRAAIDDEVRHARQCFGIVHALTGRCMGPGDLDDAPDDLDARSVLCAAIAEGCVGETIAAAQAAAARDAATDPAIRAVLAGIADDEAEHAALAWAFVRWVLDTRPELRPLAAEAFAAARLPRGGPTAGLDAWGQLSAAALRAMAERTAREVIAPAAQWLTRPIDSSARRVAVDDAVANR